MKHISFLCVTAASALLFLSACSDYVGKENTHPLFAKGMTCKTNKNYNESAKAFEEFLLLCPKSAKTHLELATIYGDSLEDYVQAIYHYRKYAELAKLTRTDSDNIRDFIEVCKRKAYEKYREDNALNTPRPDETAKQGDESVKLAALRQERDLLREKIKEFVDTNRTLASENQKMKKTLQLIAKQQRGTSSARTEHVRRPNQIAIRTDSAAQKPETNRPEDVYVVKTGDTLISISKKMYGSGSHYPLIAKANAELLRKTRGIQPGMKLRIPSLPPTTR